MQIKKKSLPLHPQLRNKPSAAIFKIASKEVENGKNKVFSKKKLQKVLQKFGSYKNLPYLCTTFGDENEAKVFENGSLNYWLYFKRENVVFICQFPLMENEVVRTLTIHYNFLQWRV